MVGEGPVWLPDSGEVLWIDIKGQSILLTDPSSGIRRRHATSSRIGAIVPCEHGGYLAALSTGFYLASDDFSTWTRVDDPERSVPGNRFNDGKCDDRGRFWVGSMDNDERDRTGALYMLDTNFHCTRVLEGLFLSNGLDWSPDGKTFYLTDTLDRVIWAFDFDMDDAVLSNRRVLIEVPTDDGYPDGLCVDESGYLWSAHWGGARITTYDPDGRVAEVHRFPVSQTSSCAFGGADLSTLFVTTAAIGLSPAQRKSEPLAGALFALATTHRGRPTRHFQGDPVQLREWNP